MELLFGGKKELTLDLPEETKTIQQLLLHIRQDILKERPELFMQGDTMYLACVLLLDQIDACRRPGVLILINEVDWELEGGLAYHLVEGDRILFISTLHGG